jgi:hypothetical protein
MRKSNKGSASPWVGYILNTPRIFVTPNPSFIREINKNSKLHSPLKAATSDSVSDADLTRMRSGTAGDSVAPS